MNCHKCGEGFLSPTLKAIITGKEKMNAKWGAFSGKNVASIQTGAPDVGNTLCKHEYSNDTKTKSDEDGNKESEE